MRTVRRGDCVITIMQGLGSVRSQQTGSYAESVTVHEDAVALLPAGFNVHHAAALGLAAVTAYEGLRRIGPLDGKRIMITGAQAALGRQRPPLPEHRAPS